MVDINIIGKLHKKTRGYIAKKEKYYKEKKPDLYKQAMDHGKALTGAVMIAKVNRVLHKQLLACFKVLLSKGITEIEYEIDGKTSKDNLEEEIKSYEEAIKAGWLG